MFLFRLVSLLISSTCVALNRDIQAIKEELTE
jgi:hypothetical protein